MGLAGAAACEVRRAFEDDWQAVRALRLRALSEDPRSFGSRVEEERANPEDRWRAWIAGGAFFVASRVGADVGLVRAQRSRENVFGIFSLWVASEARGHGVGRALLEAAERFAGEQGARELELSVIDGAIEALRLYLRAGYTEIAREPSRHQGLQKRTLRKPLPTL